MLCCNFPWWFGPGKLRSVCNILLRLAKFIIQNMRFVHMSTLVSTMHKSLCFVVCLQLEGLKLIVQALHAVRHKLQCLTLYYAVSVLSPRGCLALCDTQPDTGRASFIKIVFMLWTLHSIICHALYLSWWSAALQSRCKIRLRSQQQRTFDSQLSASYRQNKLAAVQYGYSYTQNKTLSRV